MLLGGETQVDSYNSPTSNNNLSATDENTSLNMNGNNEVNTTSLDTPPLSNVNLIQTSTAQPMQTISDEYKAVPKDTNQNFLPENNLDLYQPQHQPHISPRVHPYDLNIAHQQVHNHHLRSNSHMNCKLSPYNKNQNLMISSHQNPMYDGIVSSSNGNDMMVLKEEPENGY